jgi:hypothetical protein
LISVKGRNVEIFEQIQSRKSFVNVNDEIRNYVGMY